jgi:hypothetical protein
MISTGDWQNGTTNGTEQSPKTGLMFEWEVSLTDWDEADVQSLLDVERMDVTVHWNFENVQEQVVLSTVVYIPDTSITTTSSGSSITGGTSTGSAGVGGRGGGVP